ncbi:hypothetical protein SDC9_154911 [bioreactor metagenome]|uniref:3-keto-alpha-glucoside-1,2-lyase/3-keto-2-hydroxy-glucal hydratase domain-containing protein n=1 Tax=bioreactor metagenome TaxID=1076179 RepID=A0A645F1K5_9ZZZZ
MMGASCGLAAEPMLESLLKGDSLSAWKVPEPNPFWRLDKGVLAGENDEGLKGNVIYTKQAYKDFVLELETRWTGDVDSGVMLRKPELQLQFGTSRSLKKDMTCSFYTGGQEKYPEAGRAQSVEGLLKTGEWNHVRLEARGDRFKVWLNQKLVTDYQNTKYPGEAPVGLQIHPGVKMKVEFRNVRIAPLE